PLVRGAHHAAGAFRGDDGFFQLEGVPFGHRLPHGFAVFRHTEHAERRRAMVREIAVEITPAPVLCRIRAHHGVALSRYGGAVHLHVVRAAQRGGGLARVYRDLLAAPGAQLPELGGGEADRRERGRTRLTDAEGRRQGRIGIARDLDGAGARVTPAGGPQGRAHPILTRGGHRS